MKLKQIIRIFISIFLCLGNQQQYATQNLSNPKNKHVIGARDAGLFSNFLGVLNHLQLCHDNKLKPVVYWDSASKYYVPEGFNGSTNVWEYYFHPVSSLSYTPGDRIHYEYIVGELEDMFWGTVCDKAARDKANPLIKKYIKPKGKIRYKVDAFYNKFMAGKKTIGIHIRGTDKAREVEAVPVEKFAEIAKKYPGYQFLVATDDQKLLNDLKLLIKGTVINYDCFRSEDGSPIHIKKPSFAQLGEDVVVEVLLLARCEKLIHSLSNVSTAVLFFNNKMENFLIPSTVYTYQPGKNIDLED